MEMDMTVGRPFRLLAIFALPLVFGNLLQQLYLISDAVIVGHFVGWQGLAAIGAARPIGFLVFGLVFGVTSGFSTVTGQCYGAKDLAAVRRSVATSLMLSFLLALGLNLSFALAIDFTLHVARVPADIYSNSRTYLLIVLSGSVFTVLYNQLSGVLRALGDSRTPLYFLLISTTLNILLDLLFIRQFDWGVAGVAYATVASQLISGALCWIFVWKNYPWLRLKRADWKLYRVKDHLKLGLPMGISLCLVAIGCFVMQAMVNRLGTLLVASFSAAGHIDMLFTTLIFAVVTAVSAFVAQNYGAKRFDRICNGTMDAIILVVIISVVGGAGCMLFYPQLCRFFVGAEQTRLLLPQIKIYMFCRAPFFSIMGLMFVYRNTLHSMGYYLVPVWAGLCDFIGRSLLCWWWGSLWGLEGICFGDITSWFVTCVPLAAFYLYQIHRVTGNYLRTPYQNVETQKTL